MLSEIPPHGCGVPWPGLAGGVAEWRWGCRNGSLAGQGLERTVLPVRGGGQSPVGGRDLAVGMSRRDRSPVGNGCGEGFPEPLQGLDMAPRIARIKRVSAERICGNLRERWAICSVAVHRRFFDGAKIRNNWIAYGSSIISVCEMLLLAHISPIDIYSAGNNHHTTRLCIFYDLYCE